MESEKVKDIKEALASSFCPYIDYVDTIGEPKMKRLELRSVINLINELESENKELKKYKLDWLNGEKMHLQAEMAETEFELASSNRLFEIVSKENKQLKDRISELENENQSLKESIEYGNEVCKECQSDKDKGVKWKLKRFAQMLKEKVVDKSENYVNQVVMATDIDETLKEAIEDDK